MRLLAVLGFLVLLAQVATALYEDQAGKFDWSVQNLGRVFAVEHGSGDKRGTASAGARGTYRTLYVATDRRSRALARLDAKSGAIKWRRVLTNGDDIDSILLVNSGLLSLSGSGRNIRMWDVTDGSLLWDNVLEPSSGSTLIGVGDDRALAIGARHVSFVSLKEGAIVWSASLPMDKVSSTALSADASVLFVLGFTNSQQRIVSIDVTSGVVSEKNARMDGDIASLSKSEAGEAVLATVTLSSLKIQSLETESKKIVHDAASFSVNGAAEFAGFDASAKDALVVRLSSGKRVYARILGSLDLAVVEVLSSEGTVADASSEDAGLLHVVGTSRSHVQVKAFSPGSLTRWDAEVKLDVHGGEVAKAFGGCQLKKKDSNVPRCRVLLVLKDDGLVMTANDESSEALDSPTNVLWTREEALANIKEVRWITPAETEIEKQPLKGIPTFFEDLEQDAVRLKQLVRHVIEMSSTFFGSKTSSPSALSERQEQPNSHFFGFSKYIVLLTESGRLFAIRAETNLVAWSAFVGPEYRLFVTRDHPVIGAGAELLLVSNSSKLVWFDGDDGHQIDKVERSHHESAWVVLLPKRKHTSDEDASLRRPVALIDSESLAVTIFPTKSAGVKYPEADDFYFSRFDQESGAFVGYALEHSATDSYVARPVWSVAVPTGHTLVATSRQRDGAVVDSSVAITGDDSLLLKYLNPHMFGFVTEAFEVLHGEQKAAPVLYATLVDSVTGRVIHRVRHMHGTGPVQMVQSENWVVYAFWNAKEKRTDLVSLSLYDGAVGSHSLNLWKRPVWNDQRSSFDPRAPFVLQKAFIFPAKIETLGVTVTSRGITPQYILVGMQTGQIFKLNRALIDPRQPDKPPTPEEQNEGLMMYMPLIPLHNNLHSMVTYNQTIAGLKKIATTPVELESTTLLFAHGLDLFYLRLAPAKAFDVLPPDFNYKLLVLLCLGFFGATYVLKTLTLRKSLNEVWK